MTPADGRFIRDVRLSLSIASAERLYYLAQAIHHELLHRQLPARMEAAALELALLVDADALRRAIFSADCSPRPCACAPGECCPLCTVHREAPAAEKS